MQKTISSRRKLFNLVASFFVVSAFVWWVLSHPILDYYFYGDEMPILRLIDYIILVSIPMILVWNIIDWLRK